MTEPLNTTREIPFWFMCLYGICTTMIGFFYGRIR